MPLGVGRALLSSDEVKLGGVKRGRLLRVLHLYGDQLWAMGDRRKPTVSHVNDAELDVEGESGADAEDCEDNDATTEGALGASVSQMSLDNVNNNEEVAEIQRQPVEEEDTRLPPAEMDALLQAMLHVQLATILVVSRHSLFNWNDQTLRQNPDWHDFVFSRQ